jgi:hypothetical protein
MNDLTFDRLVCALTLEHSRRGAARLLGGLAAGSVLGSVGRGEVIAKKHKQKPKIKRNEFGCVNVGNACQNDGQCCSGICEGKKGKAKCKAHDVDGCQVGQDSCGVESFPCTTPSGPDTGVCYATTGNAGYCGALGGTCFGCNKDADCLPYCGAGAACVQCSPCLNTVGFGTACIGRNQPCTTP